MLFKATCNGTLYVYDEASREKVVAQILKVARRTGEMAIFPHAKVFFAKEPIVDLSQSGSAQYQWAKDGNRVKCKVVKHTVAGEEHTREVIGTVYAELED